MNKLFEFNRCQILQISLGSITLSMKCYAAGLSRIEFSQVQRVSVTASADASEISLFRRHAGEILWLGCAASPVGCYITSMMQQQIPKLKVLDIGHANEAVMRLSNMDPGIEFQNPNKVGSKTGSFSTVTYADAAFNVSASSSYGQTSIVSEVVFPDEMSVMKSTIQ